jgi:RHS repeat-associated protein
MSLVKNIEDDNWTKNYTYYDKKGRAIGNYSINHLGGRTKVDSKLDFVGVVQQTVTTHKRLDTDTDRVITENFAYDNQNRLLTHTHRVDNNFVETLAQNTYNELSQLSNKKVGGYPSLNGGDFLQSIDYAYNIRGWMTKINDPANLNGKLFGYSIKYDQPETDTWYKSYNGNISEVDWKTSQDGVLRRYAYAYDSLNRLTAGVYLEPNSSIIWVDYYSEYYRYDLNGNITTLSRFSKPSSGNNPERIDYLAYNYKGNQLDKITLPPGIVNNPSGYNALQNAFTYDANGNMTSHLDKRISSIAYNYLNLPSVITTDVTIKQKSRIKYTYRADGTKLKKYTNGNFIGLQTTDYLDGFQYLTIDNLLTCIDCPTVPPSTDLQFVPTSEGYYDFVKNKYIYNYTDHLGNVRVSYFKNNNNAEILEENHYYPFGLKHEGYNAMAGNPSYQYKYNGKELQENGMYDYGARFYMPDIGRWGVIDPLAEKMRRHSPYNYAFNNPIRHTDPDGKEPQDIIFRGTDNKELRIIAAGPDKVYNVPFALSSNRTLDVGIGNIDPGRLAVGYTAQGDIGGGLGIGAGGGLQTSVIQFTDSKYSGYNYVYAGAQETFSAGAQATVSASVGASVSVAYNNSKDKIDPTTYAGVTTSAGVSADVRYIVGMGANINAFSGSGKAKGWKGVSIGISAGVGAGVNVGSGNVTLSKTWLLNDVKPTAQRSLIDRATNAVSPVASAITTGSIDKIQQYNKKKN